MFQPISTTPHPEVLDLLPAPEHVGASLHQHGLQLSVAALDSLLLVWPDHPPVVSLLPTFQNAVAPVFFSYFCGI